MIPIWTHTKPTVPGIYLLDTGSDNQEAPCLVLISQEEGGRLVMDDEVDGDWQASYEDLEDLHDDHWWFGPIPSTP